MATILHAGRRTVQCRAEHTIDVNDRELLLILRGLTLMHNELTDSDANDCLQVFQDDITSEVEALLKQLDGPTMKPMCEAGS